MFDLGNSLSSKNHESPGVRFGLKFDPLAYLLGDRYRKLITKSGDAANKLMYKLNEPVFKASRKYDPIRRNVPALNNAMTWAENKPASVTGMLVGGYYGASALGGGGGGAGAQAGAQAGGASPLANPGPAVFGVEGGATGTGASIGATFGSGGAPTTGGGLVETGLGTPAASASAPMQRFQPQQQQQQQEQYRPPMSRLMDIRTPPEFMQQTVTPGASPQPLQHLSEQQRRRLIAEALLRSA